ncbi:hypothetical protein K4F52_008063 [Lecanicillium sp. MT-2017a]|nr:hypothetical protein K4F52_008063 [Lecanicillium sp. MT-2017a]
MECFPVDWIPEEATLATPMIISDLYPFTTREGLEQEASLMLSLYYHSTAPSTNPMAGHLLTCVNCAYEAMSLHKDLTANPGEDPNDRDLSADFMLPSMWHDFGMADTTETNLRASDRAAVVDMVKLYTRAYQIQSRIVDQLHNDMLLWRHLVEDEANAHVATGELWKANEDQLFFQGPSSALEKQSIWQTTVLELLGRNMMIMTHWLINATTEVSR